MRYKCILCHFYPLKYLFASNDFKIYQCSKCHLARILLWPSKSQLQKFYKEFDYETGFITEKLIRKEAKQLLRNISQYKGEILDIGCGAGFYLDEAQKVGWNVTGVETSKRLADHAKKKFNVDVIFGDFVKVKLPNKKYDVIVLSQVIEHLTDPTPMLSKIKYYLKNDGILYIATPNIASWLFKIQKQDFPYMIPPEHVYFYSPKSIKLLLNQNGFKIKSFSTYGYQQDLAGIIKTFIKGKITVSQLTNPKEYKEYPKNPIKLIKYLLFDKIFCGTFYPLLNIGNQGSMISLFTQKI